MILDRSTLAMLFQILGVRVLFSMAPQRLWLQVTPINAVWEKEYLQQ